MAFTKRTVDVQLEIHVTNLGVFSRAIGTRRVEMLEDGIVIAEREVQLSLTLAQVKAQVAALS